MPYKSMKDVNPTLKKIVPVPTLAQCNLIARWADSIKDKRGDVNPWAVAIALFKRTHHIEGKEDDRKWVKNKDAKVEGLADQVLDLIAQLEDLGALTIVDYFPWPAPIVLPAAGSEEGETYDDDLDIAGVPAFVIDLMNDVPQKPDGGPDFSQPFRILPCGPIHRFGEQRVVTVQDIALFEDNWRNRTKRGIRREKVVVDIEHEPGGVGLYTDIFSRGQNGLWAKITLTPKGEQALAERDFWYFSPTVAWRHRDRVTGEVVYNQIVGGALTNYPVFGDAAALPAGGYSEATLHRLLADGHDMSAYAITKRGGDGKDYPASAWLIVEDSKKPTTWHLRVKEYVNGKLQYTRNMISKAAQAVGPKGFRGKKLQLSPAKITDAKRKLRNLYLKTLKVPKEDVPAHLFSEIPTEGGQPMTTEFTQEDRTILDTLARVFGPIIHRKGGEPPMPEPDGTTTPQTQPGEISAEAFAEMQQGLAAAQAQIETMGEELKSRDQELQQYRERLEAETSARVMQEMTILIRDEYSHLAMPLEVPENAPKGTLPAPAHLAWLRAADATEGQVHWQFFTAVFQAAEAALAEAYGEIGSGHAPALSADEELHRAATAYAEEHKVDYRTALSAVIQQRANASQ